MPQDQDPKDRTRIALAHAVEAALSAGMTAAEVNEEVAYAIETHEED